MSGLISQGDAVKLGPYEVNTWADCYNEQWGDELVPEAFSHPAKISPGLSRRIYDHAFNMGWLWTSGTVIVTEKVLQEIIQANLNQSGERNVITRRGYVLNLSDDGRAILPKIGEIVQREPCQVIDPFGGIAGFGLQAMAHGLNFIGVELEQKFVDLGNQNIDLWRKRYALWPKLGSAVLLQGDSRNLLAAIGAAKVDGMVSSPPYAESLQGDNGAESTRKRILAGKYNGLRPDVFFSNGQKSAETFGGGYSITPGNLGNSSGSDFWSAARVIISQTYATLCPGGHAIWVVRAFVRNRQIVNFPAQWRQLCESCGFVTLHEHHAMLVAEYEQIAFDGKHKRKERKSFFRRLAESKGSPHIDYEVVLCQVKHLGQAALALPELKEAGLDKNGKDEV